MRPWDANVVKTLFQKERNRNACLGLARNKSKCATRSDTCVACGVLKWIYLALDLTSDRLAPEHRAVC